MAEKHPYTYYKASAETVAKVRIGEYAKLVFLPSEGRGERMWVRVTDIGEDGRFAGILENAPSSIEGLEAGDRIEFEARHIANTEHDPEGHPVDRLTARCFVTRRVLDEGAPVGYLYRDAPEREDDSGWRITSGKESDAYMEDPSHTAYVSLGAVMNRDDSALELLDSPVGSGFLRNPATGFFEPTG